MNLSSSILSVCSKQLYRVLFILLLLQYASCNCDPLECDWCKKDSTGNDIANVCEQCKLDYVQYNNGCCHSSCQSCNININPVSGKCTSCKNNYIVSGSGTCASCSSAISNCITCNSTGSCIQCAANYVPNGASCVSCITVLNFCSTCNNTSCLSCISNSYAVNSSNKCDVCSSMMAGCLTCSSSTVCLTCINNSFAINSSRCAPCSGLMDGCVACSSSSTCTACVNDSVTISSGSCVICQLVLTGCLTCSSPTVCTACVNNSFVMNSNQCTSCSQAIVGCLTCSSASVCHSCTDAYVINSTTNCLTCSAIMDGCLSCTSASNCTSCTNDSLALNSSNICVKCQEVLTACLNCNSSTICTACTNATFGLNLTSNKCEICSSLLAECVNCTSSLVCTACVNNSYGINSTSQCAFCYQLMVGCLSCNSSTVCLSCTNESFVLDIPSQRCVVCSVKFSLCETCNSSVCISCVSTQNIISVNQSCVECSSVIPNCINCLVTTACTLCSGIYILNSLSLCALCIDMMKGCIQCTSETVCTKCSIGQVVTNGCSITPGCVAVTQNLSSSICTQCDYPLYVLLPINGVCVCARGHLAGQYCTEIVGCMYIVRIKGQYICTACDFSKKFVLANGTCICQALYKAEGQDCVQICGDGKKYYQSCDDGNLENGDGCSSTCQIEPGYSCSDGSVTTPSRCVYKRLVRLSLGCIYKAQEENTAQIILNLNPFISNIVKSNTILGFHMSKNCSMTSFSYSGTSIILSIRYNQDIQGETSVISIEYDWNYIKNPNSSISIQLKQCNGERLYYNPNPKKSMKDTITINLKILSILVVVLWIVGSYFHKMIGVETLHTFQLIFIPQAFAYRYYPVIIYFNQLFNTLNLFQNKITPKAPLNSTFWNRLNYTDDFLFNNGFLVVVEVVVLVLFLLFTFVDKLQAYCVKNCLQNRNAKLAKLINFKQSIYNFLVFPVFIGFFLNLISSLTTHFIFGVSRSLGIGSIQTLAIVFAIVTVSFIFFREWKQFFTKGSNQRYRGYCKNYIFFYLTNLFLTSVLLEACLMSISSNPLLIIIGFCIIYTVAIIFYCPYKDCIHNFSIIINQIGILLNLVWLISQEYVYLRRAEQQNLAFFLIGYMAIIMIFAIVRIVYQIKKVGPKIENQVAVEKKKNYNKVDKQNELMNSMLQQTFKKNNQYLVVSQLMNIKLLQSTEFEKRRNQERYSLLQKKRKDQNKTFYHIGDVNL